MKILLASINCLKTEIALNLETHKRVIQEAADDGCALVVFPEMSLTGYLDPTTQGDYFLTVDSWAVMELVKFGEALSVEMLFGIAERSETGSFRIAHIHAANGSISGVYRKRHLADNENAFTAGMNSYYGEVAGTGFGVAVCADYEVPDEFVAASKSGAKVVFHSSAPGLYGARRTDESAWQAGFDWWRSSTIEKHSRRANELGLHIAMCTQAGATEDEDFPGWSALFNPDGEIVDELPDWRAGNLSVEI